MTSSRPQPLAVRQKPWTSRSFDQKLDVELFPSVLERFHSAPARADEIGGEASDELRKAKPVGKWSLQEHVGHLLDLEELGEQRLAAFLARAETLPAADMSNRKTQDANHNEANWWDLTERFRAARAELVQKLEALPADVIAHQALHPRLKRMMNVVEWVFFMCEHDDHHLAHMRMQLVDLSRDFYADI